MRQSYVYLNVFAAIVILLLFILVTEKFSVYKALPIENSLTSHHVNSSGNSHKHYLNTCFGEEMSPTIEALLNNINMWRRSTNIECQQILEKLDNIYVINEDRGRHKVSTKILLLKVKKWLNNDRNLIRQFRNQQIIHIYNRYNEEQSIYSPFRAKRPIPGALGKQLEYFNRVLEETKHNCDFCNATVHTIPGEMGRLTSKFTVTAMNAFKMDKWAGLIIPKRHSPVNLTKEEIVDAFSMAHQWFQRVQKHDPSYIYSNLVWDTMYHAGASHFHPHMHGFLSCYDYYQEARRHRSAAEKYFEDHGSDYFSDLVSVHEVLGLAVHHGDAVALADLSPRKENEFLVLSNEVGSDLWELLWYILWTYWKQHLCFSIGAFLPPLAKDEIVGRKLPTIVRLAPRGDCSGMISDASSLDFYMAPNINVDPYTVMRSLRNTMKEDTDQV